MNAASTILRPIVSRQATKAVASAIGVGASGLQSQSQALSCSHHNRRFVHIEKKIDELGIELPTAPLPKANYNIVCLPPGDDNIMYVSGHLPIKVSKKIDASFIPLLLSFKHKMYSVSLITDVSIQHQPIHGDTTTI